MIWKALQIYKMIFLTILKSWAILFRLHPSWSLLIILPHVKTIIQIVSSSHTAMNIFNSTLLPISVACTVQQVHFNELFLNLNFQIILYNLLSKKYLHLFIFYTIHPFLTWGKIKELYTKLSLVIYPRTLNRKPCHMSHGFLYLLLQVIQ